MPQAELVAEYCREAGLMELLAELMHEEDTFIVQENCAPIACAFVSLECGVDS